MISKIQSQMHTLIQLKFGTFVENPEANSRIKLRANLINIQGDIIKFMRIMKLNFVTPTR